MFVGSDEETVICQNTEKTTAEGHQPCSSFMYPGMCLGALRLLKEYDRKVQYYLKSLFGFAPLVL